MKTIEYTGGTARVTTCAGHERTWSTGEAVTVSDEEAELLLELPGFIDKAVAQPPDYAALDRVRARLTEADRGADTVTLSAADVATLTPEEVIGTPTPEPPATPEPQGEQPS